MTKEMTINETNAAIATQQQGLSREQVQLLKDTICRGSTDEELRLFVEVWRRFHQLR